MGFAAPLCRRGAPPWIDSDVQVTALAAIIGYDKASKITHHAMDNDLTLKATDELGSLQGGRVQPL
jgi:fumarate hydratase class II